MNFASNPLLRTVALRRQFASSRSAARRTFLTRTIPLWEQHLMKVPTMGDSITEGTIVEWTTQIGQAVKDGDVVALVETDKVTVEIKAEMDGVITQQFGAVDDTVEVGSDLYEIDTEAEATVDAASASTTEAQPEAPSAPTPAPVAAAVAPAPSSAPPSSSSSHSRVPSIKFLGKEGWAKRLSGKTDADTKTSTSTSTSTSQVVQLPRMYGRPEFTEEEMEAILMGGASLTPSVVAPSSGAKFKYL